MDEQALRKRNLLFFPIGTIGRDMVYCLVTSYLLTYILFTRSLNAAQLGAITAIMVAARVFDALNDPIMGNIIERTRTKWGKFKPWLVIGILLTSVVVYIVFNTDLQGWSFIWLFGAFYFLYSIAYTMHDISYWGMVPALSSDPDARNQFTSRATLCAGIGSTTASMLIPMLTTGKGALGGSTNVAYGRIALFICILAPLFLGLTVAGAKERRDDMQEAAPPISLKKVVKTIAGNDQLLWIAVIFLLQQVGNNFILGGIASLRPFLTKLSSAITVALTSVSYLVFGVTNYTNQISSLESAAAAGSITEAEKLASISQVLSGVGQGQTLGLLLCMTVLPWALMLLSYLLYKRHYKLDEEEYDRICAELAAR